MRLNIYQTRPRLLQLLPPLRNGRILTQKRLHLLSRSDIENTQEGGMKAGGERLVHGVFDCEGNLVDDPLKEQYKSGPE